MSTTNMRPGVVTGERYRDFVAAAKEGGYAIPAVNVTSTSTLNAALEAAATTNSDIIVRIRTDLWGIRITPACQSF